ncbi:predicted protein [Aspergillus terreus NIH2624]|uniref:Uncharacterized protein n=1 Tax=Aspergillus terreus (strain NIH 2624 / FGSC A1156) TaxID=341663 RepID=Q0CBQ9_ASPTN|nr:uncharacterized protein ATEG_08875 [Aspergillus terreus NIH2624]EAU31007.1 predicted protein [Aspergillus terreus NIH2624]
MASTTAEKILDEVLKSSNLNNAYYQAFQPNYKVADHLLGDKSKRKIRVVNVGSGLASINLAYFLSTTCENFELTLLERAPQLGGVWNHNCYPGVACDVPSHIYQFSWAPNPDWSHFLSPGSEICAYLNKVVDTMDLRKYIQFNTELLSATWDERGFWKLRVRRTEPGREAIEEDLEAEIFVNNSGTQDKPLFPEIPGLEAFHGKLLHTARWDASFGEEQWKNKTVAVIGTGASAVQVAAKMQPHVDKLIVYGRTPVWFSPGLASEGNFAYSEAQKHEFRSSPQALVNYAKKIERQLNFLFPAIAKSGSVEQKETIKALYKHMENRIHDRTMLKNFTPRFPPGCRRITPGDAFLEAIQKPNAELIPKGVTAITEDGLIDDDGHERKVDVIVCATGFLVDFIPTFDVVGKNGARMAEAFAEKRDAYMGIAVPEFPNYFYGTGPYWTTANGSLISSLNAASQYICQVVNKLQTEYNIVSVCPSRKATDDFVEHAQTWMKGAVWSGNCPSWYKIQKGRYAGRCDAVWPGITLHFVRALAAPRWEDYDIQYDSREDGSPGNRFAYLGRGFVPESVDPSADDSPHLNVRHIDERWTKAASLGTK